VPADAGHRIGGQDVVVIMGSDRKAGVTLARCGIPTWITASQFAALSALPDPVGPVTPHFVCELAFSHDDDHVALAVASDRGDQWWWVRWGRQRPVVVQIDPCEVPEPDVPALEFCLLPAGHPGSHSCDLLPWPAGNVDGQLN
jgi:hypothetical protein